jgi:cyanophycinase-like exopeptidase
MATHKQIHLLRYLLEQKIQVIDQAARQKLRDAEIMAILTECTAVFDTDSEQAQGQVLTLPHDIERTVRDELRMACA